jgi:hypothetical protein
MLVKGYRFSIQDSEAAIGAGSVAGSFSMLRGSIAGSYEI